MGTQVGGVVLSGSMSELVPYLTDSTFDEEVASTAEPVLVDFTAAWCTPCKTLSPILDELAEEQKGNLRIVKIDVDENPKVTMRFGVRSMPTLIVLQDGQEAKRLVGARPKRALLEEVAEFLPA